MADELVEPQEIVPEQAEFFASEQKTIGERMEEPLQEEPPAPGPEPAPAEPEPPPVEPDWLNTPAPVPEAAPQLPPQQYYEPPPQQYQQPPQPAPRTDAELEAFVNNPEGWFEQRMSARDQQRIAPLMQQQAQVQNMMGVIMNNAVNDNLSRADQAIKQAYNSFNKDSTFRSNKAMQDKIGATLQGMRQRAEHEARNGNFSPLNALSNLTEADIAGTLAYVRAATGTPSPGVGPVQVEGATVESSRSAVADSGVTLSAEQEEIAKRMGAGYRDRMIQGIKDQQKYDDLEFSE